MCARNFALWEEERQKVLWQLNCHIDNDGIKLMADAIRTQSRGLIQPLLEQHLAGYDVSVRQGKCLVRGQSRNEGYDIHTFKRVCLVCGTKHHFNRQRSIWKGPFISSKRRDASAYGSRQQMFLAFLDDWFYDGQGSHLCSN